MKVTWIITANVTFSDKSCRTIIEFASYAPPVFSLLLLRNKMTSAYSTCYVTFLNFTTLVYTCTLFKIKFIFHYKIDVVSSNWQSPPLTLSSP